MSQIILVPVIMGIAIVSVVGIRAVYRATNKDKDGSQGNGKKWDVEEFTSNLNK